MSMIIIQKNHDKDWKFGTLVLIFMSLISLHYDLLGLTVYCLYKWKRESERNKSNNSVGLKNMKTAVHTWKRAKTDYGMTKIPFDS